MDSKNIVIDQLQKNNSKISIEKEWIERFIKESKEHSSIEGKLRCSIDIMNNSLGDKEGPYFKVFWKVRKSCLEFFKERIDFILRKKFWEEYLEITEQARKLKTILEEQTKFSIEQLDLAIKTLKEDTEKFEKLLDQVSEIQFPEEIEIDKEKYAFLQKRVSLLNNFAERINSLKKEIINTEMRLGQKNIFFKTLSRLGDKIFPQRKQAISQISIEFEKDVENFMEKYFGKDKINRPFYILKDDIKAYQNLAKILIVNPKIFTQTRLKLSNCWNLIRDKEKKRKEQVKVRKEHEERLEEEMKTFAQRCKETEITEEEIKKDFKRILGLIKEKRLDKEKLEELVNRLESTYGIFERKTIQIEKEKQKIKNEKVTELKNDINKLILEKEKYSIEDLENKKTNIKDEIKLLKLSNIEKQFFDRALKPFEDIISDKKENALLELSDDDKEKLLKLEEILENKKRRKDNLREQIENYRKALGGSNLDFEKAMIYREMMEKEKERLKESEKDIEEIEQKVEQIKNK